MNPAGPLRATHFTRAKGHRLRDLAAASRHLNGIVTRSLRGKQNSLAYRSAKPCTKRRGAVRDNINLQRPLCQYRSLATSRKCRTLRRAQSPLEETYPTTERRLKRFDPGCSLRKSASAVIRGSRARRERQCRSPKLKTTTICPPTNGCEKRRCICSSLVETSFLKYFFAPLLRMVVAIKGCMRSCGRLTRGPQKTGDCEW